MPRQVLAGKLLAVVRQAGPAGITGANVSPAFMTKYHMQLKPHLRGVKLSTVVQELLPSHVTVDKSGDDVVFIAAHRQPAAAHTTPVRRASAAGTSCRSWRRRGYCMRHAQGGLCPYKHAKEERAAEGDERRDCWHWMRGRCPRSDDECNFRHDPSLFDTA